MNKIGNKIFALTLAGILAGGSVYTSANVVYATADHQYDLVELQRSKLLTNNQFENGNNSWNIVGGKVVSDNQSLGQSGKLEKTSDAHADGHIWQNVTLKPDTTYTLKAKVKVLSENKNDYVTLDVKKGGINEAKYFKDIKVNASTDQWQDVELNFTTDSQTTYCVGIGRWVESATETQKNSEAYLDNVELICEEELVNDNYEIIWADDFNENSLNTNNWEYELGCIRGQEQQHYVNDKENVFMRDGQLVLKVTDRDQEDQYQNPRNTNKTVIYNSGSVRTHGKQEFLYGRIEIKAKLPQGQGVFPAFWTLGSDFTLDGDIASDQGYGWARCGEIDIMEFIGGTDGAVTNKQVWQTAHTDDGTSEDNAKLAGKAYTLPNGDNFYDEYHVFGIDWSPNKLEWYVDDQIVCSVDYSDTSIERNRIAQKALNRPQYVQLNLATGGSWTDSVAGGLSKDLAGAEFAIDYIYYGQNEKQKAAAEAYYETAPKLNGITDLEMYEGESTDLLSKVSTTSGYFVDYSIENSPMFTSKGGLTSVDLVCKGKDDLESLSQLPAGTYNIHYSAIPSDLKLNSKNAPLGTENYKFARKTAKLTIKERSLTTDLNGKELSGYVGDPLSTVSLPQGWSWKNDNEIISNDTNAVVAIFTNNGFIKEDTVKINIHESVTTEQLSKKVEEANQYLKQTDIYTEESLNTLKEAVDYAELLLKQRAPATFAQITEAYRNVDTAIHSLVKIEKEDDKISWTELTPAKPINPDNTTNTPSQDNNIQNTVQDNNHIQVNPGNATNTPSQDNNIQVNTNHNNQTTQNTQNQVKTSDTTPVALTTISMLVSGVVIVVYYKRKKAIK